MILELAVRHISSMLNNQCIHVVPWKLREEYTYSHYSYNNTRNQKKDGKRKINSYVPSSPFSEGHKSTVSSVLMILSITGCITESLPLIYKPEETFILAVA